MQKKNNYLPIFLTFAIISAVLLLLWKVGALNAPSGIISKMFSGPRELSIKTINGNSSNLIPSPDLADREKLEKENRALKDQFALPNPSSRSLLPALVIGAPSFIPGVTTPDVFILDRGETDGVKKGQAVVFGASLIGKISDVNSFSSKAILINNSSISFTGKLDNGTIGVVKGSGDGIEIGNVLLSDHLEKGDTVLTKGDQDISRVGFPPDLVIGKILSVEKRPSDLFQKAEIKTQVDLTRVSTVFIVVK